MRSLKFQAVMSFILGAMFLWLAIQTAGDTIWTFKTMFLAGIAAFDFGLAIKLIRMDVQRKDRNKKE
ncbi:MAG TPA: YdiK family protein [Cerasibacillus sp.]|uniref:YdiK family protein n=1 Tax=Cerasibacillus sp. TaxID=2498711 RepID=UPI002F4175C6